MYIYYIPPPLTVHFSMRRSVRYQPILHTLYYTLHTEHAYCLSYHFLNNVVITTVIEMVEMVVILYRRLGKRSVERVRYVINNLIHLVIVKYGVISLVLCISTRLWLVTILSLLVKYLVIFHANPCNKSYIYIYIESTTVLSDTSLLAQLNAIRALPSNVSAISMNGSFKTTLFNTCAWCSVKYKMWNMGCYFTLHLWENIQ